MALTSTEEEELREDKLLVENSNHLIYGIEEKWYNRGEKEIALELDRLAVKKVPIRASGLANLWYNRGEKEIALEFDKFYLQDFTFDSDIADKWYERGEKEIALEFNKLNAQDSPDSAGTIADQWYERGEKETALEFDKLRVQDSPYAADVVADKWYNRGEKEIALEFDKLGAQNSPSIADAIASKWYDRGEHELALDFEETASKVYPRSALKKVSRLIKDGKFAEAEEFGNKMLEHWVSQSDEKIREDLRSKLHMAALLESPYYYEILISKIAKGQAGGDIIENYTKFLENIPLSAELKDISITDYLMQKIKINPEFLEKYNISLDLARKMVETDIYELAKKGDIPFSILHVIALHAKQDPYFKLHIFYEQPLGDRPTAGVYWSNLERVSIHGMSKSFRGTLIHEWTHQVMDVLFRNASNPYKASDKDARKQWDNAMNKVFQKLNEYLKQKNTNSSFDQMLRYFNLVQSSHYYKENEYPRETIAFFVDAIGMYGYEDPQVKEFFQPLYDYWVHYIDPVIKNYIKEHAKLDTFVSDWERENILDPFYRLEIEGSELERDLKTVQSQPEKAKPLVNLENKKIP